MAGHNKWSKIKHKKAATDAKKSKEFSRLVREIKTAVRESGGDETASAVRLAVDRAKQANMPKDNIERAIKSAQGAGGAEAESIVYETYGPGGAAVIIDAETDNRNRTGAEIRKLLSNHGAELAAPGAATWAFEKNEGVWEAKQTTPVASDDKQKLSTLIDALDEHDDVVSVVTNAE